MREVLLPAGLRVVCTCRPGAVAAFDGLAHFESLLTSSRSAVIELEERSEEQQLDALKAQMKSFPSGAQFAEHLTALTELREGHVQVYEKSFNASERRRIEGFSPADRRFLNGIDGPLDTRMLPSAASGRGGKPRLSAEHFKYEYLGSRYLKKLCSVFSEMKLGKMEKASYGMHRPCAGIDLDSSIP